jgi:hypothetical protein
MAVVDALLFVVAAGFAVIVVATILVIVGVRQEERHRTIAGQGPPTIMALLARRILGTYIYYVGRDEPERDNKEINWPDKKRHAGPVKR